MIHKYNESTPEEGRKIKIGLAGQYYELMNRYEECQQDIIHLTEELNKRQHLIDFLCTKLKPVITPKEMQRIKKNMFPM